MLIKAKLKGHEFDLITLEELFREGDPTVATDDEGYYLGFTAPDGLLADGSRLYETASVVLRRVNAIGRVLTDEFRPVGLTGRFHDEAGQQHHVVLADSAEARGRAFAAVVTVGQTGSGRRRHQYQGQPTCSWHEHTPTLWRSWRSSASQIHRPTG
jgi:hypothetical protein